MYLPTLRTYNQAWCVPGMLFALSFSLPSVRLLSAFGETACGEVSVKYPSRFCIYSISSTIHAWSRELEAFATMTVVTSARAAASWSIL